MRWDNKNDPDYILPKSSVKYIIFQNGTVESINDKPDSLIINEATPYFRSKKNLIGINYFDIVYLNFNVFYERFFPKINLTTRINISPGFGRDNANITFLGFAEDYFHGMLSINFFPGGFQISALGEISAGFRF